MKLTPIFPAHIKPVRVGVYLTTVDATLHPSWYSYWDGRLWCIESNSVKVAKDWSRYAAYYQDKHWQGVDKT